MFLLRWLTLTRSAKRNKGEKLRRCRDVVEAGMRALGEVLAEWADAYARRAEATRGPAHHDGVRCGRDRARRSCDLRRREIDLVLNLKTAKTLALTIPPSLLARADQVIE